MSATTSSPSPPRTTRDNLVDSAKSMPDLVAKAETDDPVLAKALTGQAQQFSVTPIGTVLTMLVSGAAARYGLGWSPEFCAVVGGAIGLGGGYLVHWAQAAWARHLLAKSARPVAL